MVKLEIFILLSSLEQLRTTLRSVGAGAFGNYDSVLSYSRVKSSWRALEGANPHIGEIGVTCVEDEYKIEVCCSTKNLEQTILAIKKIHPYEEPVINIIPLITPGEIKER